VVRGSVAELRGKAAAGQGIGQAAALAMAAEGATVYATDVNAQLLKALITLSFLIKIAIPKKVW
jgi:NAD(P)-dependent dehydrogenase (short-subunit alcohol dehydrogenase family)